MPSMKKVPLIIPLVTLAGVIESDVQFVEDRRRPRCWFTLKTKQQDLFFVQAYEERIELCRALKKGDVVVATTRLRSFLYHHCGKHHVYFELLSFVPASQLSEPRY